MLMGEPIGAEEANRIGLVNRVTPIADLRTIATSMAEFLADRGRLLALNFGLANAYR